MALTDNDITAKNFQDFYNKILPYLNGGGVGLKLLWENSDPTSAFSAGSVALSSDDYDLLLTIYRWSTTSDTNLSVVSVKGQGISADLTSNSSNVARIYERYATITDSTHIAFSDCTYTGGTTDNRNAIPYRIYGIKVYNRDVPGKTTLLWSNPDPSSDFSAQNITLDNSDYDMLECVFVYSKSSGKQHTEIFSKGSDTTLSAVDGGSSGMSGAFRDLTRTSDTVYSASAGKFSSGGAATTTRNDVAIPLYIYGIKL